MTREEKARQEARRDEVRVLARGFDKQGQRYLFRPFTVKRPKVTHGGARQGSAGQGGARLGEAG